MRLSATSVRTFVGPSSERQAWGVSMRLSAKSVQTLPPTVPTRSWSGCLNAPQRHTGLDSGSPQGYKNPTADPLSCQGSTKTSQERAVALGMALRGPPSRNSCKPLDDWRTGHRFLGRAVALPRVPSTIYMLWTQSLVSHCSIVPASAALAPMRRHTSSVARMVVASRAMPSS